MSLQSELASYFADVAATMPASRRATIENAGRALRESGIFDRALKQGDFAPDFELPASSGESVALASLLRTGPAIVSFNRGGWCPFCNLELRAYQKAFAEIRQAGGNLLAIMPQTTERSRAMAEKMGLSYLVLSDRGCRVAERFGIAFELPDAMRQLYRELDHPLPDHNGTDDWKLPIPATYIVGTDGRIVLADVDTHVQHRLEPLDAIEAVRNLTRSRNEAA